MLRPATALDELDQTLKPSPLETDEELDAFYRDDLNTENIRGSNLGRAVVRQLDKSYRDQQLYKIFLMGPSGVGMSTEISKILRRVRGRFSPVRFDVWKDLNFVLFQPFDVLLLMMIRLTEETRKPVAEGGAGHTPDDRLLERIWAWFATDKTINTREIETSVAMEAGIEPGALTIWAKVLGLFAKIKNEFKYSSDRKSEVIEYRLSRIDTLVALVNDLIKDSAAKLKSRPGEREWLFVGESFDKPGVSRARIEDLFINHGSIFQSLNAHLIFEIPLDLVDSHKQAQLPVLSQAPRIIPDTPVFGPAPRHQPHREGQAAIRKIIEARVSPDLFKKGQLARLIVASGGNLRDLFSMIIRAREAALDRDESARQLTGPDVSRAIIELRSQYRNRLGHSDADPSKIEFKDKADRLMRLYRGEREAEIRDPVLNQLLLARVVQEFDGPEGRWLGVHPLIVDILVEQGRISQSETGEIPGGTL